MNNHLRIISASVGFGKLDVTGGLGYRTSFPCSVFANRPLEGCRIISAHAPSSVELEFDSPMSLFGFLNCSAKVDRANPVEFWADWNYVGQATDPAETTAEVQLQPGRHVLKCTVERDNRTRHSLWALKKTGGMLPKSHLTIATPQTTAVLTIGCYPSEEVHRQLRVLLYSAKKHGTQMYVLGVGQPYVCHTETKIRQMRNWIEALPESFSHILFVDGRDSILCQPLEQICKSYNRFSSPIVIGAEACCYPCRASIWSERFPARKKNRKWVSSGNWMGTREALLKVLAVMIEVAARMSGNDSGGLEHLWQFRKYRHNDQFLWQLCYVEPELLPNGARIELDSDFRCFANIACSDWKLDGNADFMFDGDRIIVKSSGAKPGVLHFSSVADKAMHQWAGKLGVLAK